jgi:hypothetical protein
VRRHTGPGAAAAVISIWCSSSWRYRVPGVRPASLPDIDRETSAVRLAPGREGASGDGNAGRRLGGTENASHHHFRREIPRRDYSAITRRARFVMEVLVLLSGSAANPEIDG